MAKVEAGLNPSYVAERDRMRSELDEAYRNADSLAVGLRGIVKAGIAVARAVFVPIIAAFLAVGDDNRKAFESFKDESTVKQGIRRNDDWWKGILKTFGYTDQTIAALDAMIPDDLPGPNIIHFAYIAFFILRAMGDLGRVVSGDTYKKLMGVYRPSTPQASDAIRASFVAPELDENVKRILRENGFTEEDIKVLYVANYALQDLQTIRTVYYREGKSDAWLHERLSEHGFTPERIAEIKSTFPTLPTIQDLVYFLAREAFEPDMIARYGLDELYPQDMTVWAQKMGLDESWAKRYWYAHWEHPGLQTVFELFHRDQIDQDQIWNYFGLVEIPPFWRQRLINISYNVVTRVDARRFYELGVIDEARLEQIYRHMGYSPEDAKLYTEFTKAYAASHDRDLTRSDIEQAYIDRDLSETEAIEYLVKTGWPRDYATFIIYRVAAKMDRDAREEKLELVKKQFVGNLISEAEARNQCVGLGFKVERINELVEKWRFLQWENTKLPSKTDLDKLLRNGIITEVQYKDTMKRLGYNDTFIGWYLKLIKAGAEE
jgi:hypothetical protein